MATITVGGCEAAGFGCCLAESDPPPASALMAMGLPAAGAEASGVRWKKGEQHLLDERFGEVPAACGVCGTTDTCKWRRGP